MAILLSKNELNYARKKFYGQFYRINEPLSFFDKLINKLLTYVYIFKHTLINIKRTTCRYLYIPFSTNRDQNFTNIKISLSESAVNKISKDLMQNNFAFVENFLTQESHSYLINNWPDVNYFRHQKKIIKHYNIAYLYSPNKSVKKIFGKFNDSFAIRNFYEYILSDPFTKFYNNLVSFEKKNYYLYAIFSSMAAKDSYLAPHIDSISKQKEIKQPYNFIYFLDGYEENPTLGGATGIYKDNEFRSPILIPRTIRNSLLIYNQSENFYHGFKAIECPEGVYRKTLNFQIKPK